MGSETFNRYPLTDRNPRNNEQLRFPHGGCRVSWPQTTHNLRSAGQRLRLTAREDGCDGERWATMMDLGEGAEVGERWAMDLPLAPQWQPELLNVARWSSWDCGSQGCPGTDDEPPLPCIPLQPLLVSEILSS